MAAQFAQLMLLSWIPLVLILFTIMRPREAVITAFIAATLFLPSIGFSLPGLPDFGKTSATVYAALLAILIFDVGRVISMRFCWYDAPMFLFCVGCPIISSTLNNSGAYEAASAILEQFFFWGFPYLIGRIYLSDLEGMKRFGLGLVIGGLIYCPLCLIELRFSPQISSWVYGFNNGTDMRYGGYRPRVFFNQGLELGIWMTSSTLMAWALLGSGAVKRLLGYSFKSLTICQTVVTLLCKATGALLLLTAGLTSLWIVRRTKQFWPIWLLLAVAPTYAFTRTTGLWSGQNFVEITQEVFGPDRAQSVEFRFQCEEILFGFVREKPIFGFGRLGGFNKGEKGKGIRITPDGYWIIVMGTYGSVGLVMIYLMHATPIVLMMRRFPARTWGEPTVAPASALTLMLCLFTIEYLSNALPNQVYALVMGGGMMLSASKQPGKHRTAIARLSRGLGLANDGHEWEAEAEFRRVIDQCSGRHAGLEGTTLRAVAFEGLGQVLRKSGRLAEAESAFREALFDRSTLASMAPSPERSRDLGLAHEALARVLADLDQVGQAIEARRRAMEIWDDLIAGRPNDPDLRSLRADALNDLAWLLTAGGDPSRHDPAQAAGLAAEAARQVPDRPAFWNTLGVARYRSDDWAGAVEALERSVEVGPPGGTAFDLFFLAMAYFRLGQVDRAKECHARATRWADRHRPDHHGLASFRREVEAMLDAEG